jgi:hypothetical protein
MDSNRSGTSPIPMLATPTAIQCDRCRLARGQAVMARVRHIAGREKSEWACPECAAVWAFASNSAVEFVPRVISALRPSICPSPLVARWRSPAKWADGLGTWVAVGLHVVRRGTSAWPYRIRVTTAVERGGAARRAYLRPCRLPVSGRHMGA